VIQLRSSPLFRRPQDEWRWTIALVRSERGACIVCFCTPQLGHKSEAEQDMALDEPHRIAANIAKLPELRGTVTERPVSLVGSRNQAGG